MKMKTIMAVAAAAAFSLPAAALAQAGGPAGASAQGTGATGGVPRTGSMGEPKDFTGHAVRGSGTMSGAAAMDFNTLDKNRDGNISRAEWDAHHRAAAGGGTGATTPSGIGATGDRTPSSAPTGTTAGPGTVSPRTGTGSATATQPGISGHGTPK